MKGNHKHFLEKWNTLNPQSVEGKRYLSLRGRETARSDYERGQSKKAVDRLLAVIRLGVGPGGIMIWRSFFGSKQYDEP
jgi:hypothetical protein